MKTIAIVGATSHIAKNIIFEMANTYQYQMRLYARSVDKLHSFLIGIQQFENSRISCHRLEDFNDDRSEVIINCIGIGDPGKLDEDYYQIFRITERFDNLILDHLMNDCPDSLYINLSSGAIYGTDFGTPSTLDASTHLPINNLSKQNYYGIAKLNAEAKHRSLAQFNIVDLRVYSFYSQFIDFNSKFMMTEIVNCIKENKRFITGPNDMIRDYISPQDFCNLLDMCIGQQTINGAYDVYSLAPVSKLELLEMFQEEFGLKYDVDERVVMSNATGDKSLYYSENKVAADMNYYPSSTSLDCIREETKKILEKLRLITKE